MAVFVVSASSRSVLGELYGDHEHDPVASEHVTHCASELATLERELLSHAAEDVRVPKSARDTQPWIAAWDRRYAELGACGPLEPTRLKLFRLRERTIKAIHSLSRTTLPLTENIERSIERFEPRPSRSPEET